MTHERTLVLLKIYVINIIILYKIDIYKQKCLSRLSRENREGSVRNRCIPEPTVQGLAMRYLTQPERSEWVAKAKDLTHFSLEKGVGQIPLSIQPIFLACQSFLSVSVCSDAVIIC